MDSPLFHTPRFYNLSLKLFAKMFEQAAVSFPLLKYLVTHTTMNNDMIRLATPLSPSSRHRRVPPAPALETRKEDLPCQNYKHNVIHTEESDPKGSEILDRTVKLFTAVTPYRTCSHLHPFFTHPPIS